MYDSVYYLHFQMRNQMIDIEIGQVGQATMDMRIPEEKYVSAF